MNETNIPTTKLYRIENPNIPVHPDNDVSHKALVGQWFTDDPGKIIYYIRKSAAVPGAQVVVASLPTDSLAQYHVHQNPDAKGMDVEPDNYLLPRDGTVETSVVPIDDLVAGLQLENIRQRMEAGKRVAARLGELSLLPRNE